MIQHVLTEAGIGGIDDELVSVDASGVEAAADWDSLRSAENYVGYERTENFASPGDAVLNSPHVYDFPTRFSLNQWALGGEWTVGEQAIVLNAANGRIVVMNYDGFVTAYAHASEIMVKRGDYT